MAVAWEKSPLDPDETRDYGLDWSKRLGTDTIVASSWVLPTSPPGLTKVIDSFTDATTLIRIKVADPASQRAALIAAVHTLVNTVTTAGGQILQQSVRLRVQEL